MGKPKNVFVIVVACFAFFVVISCMPALAQSAATEPRVTGTLSNVTRVESWSYFVPPPDAGSDPTYTLLADRAELGARVEGRRFDLSASFNYVRLENLPTNAIGPGGLGPGAFYFYSSGVRYSYQLYLNGLTLRVKSRAGGLSFTGGRMPFSSGGEASRHAAALDTLTEDRLASRLIGTFESSLYQRRFDGVRLDVDRPAWHLTSAVFVPTQGGYEESANLSMTHLQVATASWTERAGTAEAPRAWQAFAHLYRDRRPVTVRPDNTGIFVADHADVSVVAFGGSHASITPTSAGEADVVVWGAAEAGDWYGLAHRAASVAIEGGHRWTRAPGTPWVRAGYLYATGDRNPVDAHHGTFFSMLPSSRQYALSSIYAQMNLRDLFGQLRFDPGRVKTRLELHRLTLASGQDLWYQGSGATASHGPYFGFSGRDPGGATSLGTVLEGTADLPIVSHWSLNGYVGTMWGGGAVRASFAGDRWSSWYLENVIRF